MELVYLLVGVFIGAVIASVLALSSRTYGVLKIDHSNPDKDMYRIVVSEKELTRAGKKKSVLLRIDHNADLSQE